MKANSSGTWAEQKRFRCGFLTAKQRPMQPSCGNCLALDKRYDPKDNLHLSCWLHHFSVAAGSICNDWRAAK